MRTAIALYASILNHDYIKCTNRITDHKISQLYSYPVSIYFLQHAGDNW